MIQDEGVCRIQLYQVAPNRMKSNTFLLAIQKTRLDDLQKLIFYERFVRVVETFQARCFRLSLLFHTLRILVTVGSLLVPALLSIQYSDSTTSITVQNTASFAYQIYWATWVISLLVTTSNGVVSVFKIDKKYYFLHTTLEQLKSEAWQYLELSGRYSGFHTPGTPPTHANQFIYFCHAVEKIKMHQVEEEYFKLTDSHVDPQKSQTLDGKKENVLVHPTPQASLEEIAKTLPPDLRRQLISMVQLDGATTVPVSSHVQTETVGEKTFLQETSNTQVS